LSGVGLFAAAPVGTAAGIVRAGGPSFAAVPAPRYDAAMAYDPATNQLVLFGGLGENGPLEDTWLWNGTSWSQAHPSTGPTTPVPFGGSAMTYDEARRALVLITTGPSGHPELETWRWDGSTWTELHPAHSPSAPDGDPTMAYDPASRQIVLLAGTGPVGGGGVADFGPTETETWTWDGTDWTGHGASAVPPAAGGQALAADPATGQLLRVGTGGYQDFAVTSAETWAWTGASWHELSPATLAPAMGLAPMAYDPSLGLVRFGGSTGTPPCQNASSTESVWNGKAWTARADSGVQPAAGAAMAYDAGTGQLVVFGGCRGGAHPPARAVLLDDTVVLAGPSPSQYVPPPKEVPDCWLREGSSFVEPTWLSDLDEMLQRKALQRFPITVKTLSISKDLNLNLAPFLEVGGANLCAQGVVGSLAQAVPWEGGQLSLRAKPARGSGVQVGLPGELQLGPFVYSGEQTAWTSTPGAPPDQPYQTRFDPVGLLKIGPSVSYSLKQEGLALTVAEIDFASIGDAVDLVANGSEILSVALTPTLAFEAQISKDDLAKRLADDETQAEQDGDPDPQQTAIDEVSEEVSGDVTEGIAVELSAGGEAMADEVATELAQEFYEELEIQLFTVLSDSGASFTVLVGRYVTEDLDVGFAIVGPDDPAAIDLAEGDATFDLSDLIFFFFV
jgi:hypothetical protein